MSRHFDHEHFFFTCSLPGLVEHDTKCNLYIGERSLPVLTTTIWGKRTSTKQQFCQFSITINDLLRSLHLVQQKHASCDYSSGREPKSLSPRSDAYSLTDIVEKESSMVSINSAFTKTTGVTPRPAGVSTFLTETTTAIFSSASTEITSTNQNHMNVASGDKTDVCAVHLCAFKTQITIWKLVVVVAGLGVTLGVISLGLALHCTKRRTERSSNKRTQAKVTDEFMCMRNIDRGGLLRAGNDETMGPGTDSPSGSEKLSRQELQCSAIYHVYDTISEKSAASALNDMVYSSVWADLK
ncbi:uncharacterized protein LOC113154447 isoform X2 [Anabas testudineus]|nr:uncharacterized protein LOC113154447 isoform X2 [Anabas testudineus]